MHTPIVMLQRGRVQLCTYLKFYLIVQEIIPFREDLTYCWPLPPITQLWSPPLLEIGFSEECLFSSTQVLSVPLHSDPVWGSCENIAFANRPRQWFKWRWYFKLLPREVFTSSARTSWVLLYPQVLISTGNWLWEQPHILLMGDSAGQPGSFLEVMYGLVCAWISAYFILCVILEALGNEIKRWWEKIHIKEQMNVSYVLPIKFGFGQCISWSLYHM